MTHLGKCSKQHSSHIVSSGPVFSGFLAIFGKFEVREKSFEFSHESGQKKSQKKSVVTGKNRFFFVFFLPTFMGELKGFFPGFKFAKNS